MRLLVDKGMRLGELQFKDSYSHEMAVLFLGAHWQKALLDRYSDLEEHLQFKIHPA